jgi:hypothetical protein
MLSVVSQRTSYSSQDSMCKPVSGPPKHCPWVGTQEYHHQPNRPARLLLVWQVVAYNAGGYKPLLAMRRTNSVIGIPGSQLCCHQSTQTRDRSPSHTLPPLRSYCQYSVPCQSPVSEQCRVRSQSVVSCQSKQKGSWRRGSCSRTSRQCTQECACWQTKRVNSQAA